MKPRRTPLSRFSVRTKRGESKIINGQPFGLNKNTRRLARKVG
jgi:hypothetical protein